MSVGENRKINIACAHLQCIDMVVASKENTPSHENTQLKSLFLFFRNSPALTSPAMPSVSLRMPEPSAGEAHAGRIRCLPSPQQIQGIRRDQNQKGKETFYINIVGSLFPVFLRFKAEPQGFASTWKIPVDEPPRSKTPSSLRIGFKRSRPSPRLISFVFFSSNLAHHPAAASSFPRSCRRLAGSVHTV